MSNVISTGTDEAGFRTLQSIATAKKFNAWMYETIKPYIKGQILELGSGIGNISELLASENTSLILSDYNPEYCRYLNNKFRGNKHIQQVLSIDLQDPEFQKTYQSLENTIDTIILLNVIEHLADDKKCVKNCHFLLRPDGHFIVLAPAYQFLFSALDKEIGHYRRYTTNRLGALLQQNGFAIAHKQYFNGTGIAGWLVFNKIVGRKTITEGSMKNFERLVPLARWLDKITGNRFGLSAIVVGKKTAQ